MNKNCIFCLSVLILIPLAYSLSSSSFASISFLGIPPKDEDYFKAEVVKCRNGSKKFRRAQLNDDFCDCPDGTDEPGTSACPLGKFYCWNAGEWEKFENAYSMMVFSNGDGFWNGPDRSLNVQDTLSFTGYLSRRFVSLMSTPLRCLEGKLKELEQKLDSMFQKQARSHDEL